ncbi:MAG: potassium channel protein [Rhodothermaceae bacterium]|nr:potassium channel protein [Rhodothermaceae bacterium]
MGSAILLGILGLGTVGYVLVEGWGVLDAFYMTFITLTTIGFAEVAPLSPVGKLFTIAISAVGIGTFAYIASRTVQSLVTSQAFRQRRMERKIDQLSGHYIIAGYGRLGQRIARDLTAAERDIVIIDRRDDRAEQLTADGFLYVQNDAEEEGTLRAAGLERAAGLVLVLPQDAANVFVALTAREIRPDEELFIVARTNEQSSLNKLLRAGADKVISPLEIGADRIAQTILRPRVDRFMEQVLGVDALDFDMEEVEVHTGSLLAGRSLAEVEFKRRFNAIVVGVQQADRGQWRFNPDATIPIDAGDTLIVLGPADMIRRIRQEGCSPTSSLASVR